MIIYVLLILILACIGAKVKWKGIHADYMGRDSMLAIEGLFVLLSLASQFAGFASLTGTAGTVYLWFRKFSGELIIVPAFFYFGYGLQRAAGKQGRPSLRRMTVGKMAKLLFQFVIAVLLFALLGAIQQKSYSAGQILLSLVGWSSVGNNHSYVFAALVLGLVTLACYSLPGRKTPLVCSTVLTLCFCWVMSRVRPGDWYNIVIAWPAGMWFAEYKDRLERPLAKNGVYWSALVLLAAGLVLCHSSWTKDALYMLTAVLFGLFTVLLTMKISVRSPILKYCGDHMFSLYMLANIPLSLLQLTPIASQPLSYFLLSLALTFLLSYAFDAVVRPLWNILYRGDAAGRLPKMIHGFTRYRFLLAELVKKGVVLKYRRSYLGLIWTLLEPLLNMIVLTFVFGTLFGNSDKTYPVYILSGRLLYSCFSQSTNAALRSIRSNSGMINKVYVPKYLYPLSGVLYSYVIFLFSLIVLVGVSLVLGVWPTKYILLAPIPLLLLLLFSFGIGMILSTLGVFFRDVEYLWGVALTLLMYLCAIFYYPDRFMSAGRGWVLECNPLFCIIQMFRSCIYGEPMSMTYLLYAALWSAGSILVGLVVFYKKQDEFVLHI